MSAENGMAYRDGKLVGIQPTRVLVESEEDLALLAGRVSAGTVAHVAGYEQCWQLSAAGEWIAYEGEEE